MSGYLRLVRKFPLIPIRSEAQLDRATKVMHELVDVRLKRERTPEEEAYLSVLCDLIGKYEEKAYPFEPVEDSEVLEHFLEDRGVSQAALARGTGIAESTISAVLHGKRKLTREQIGTIANWFGISPKLFNVSG